MAPSKTTILILETDEATRDLYRRELGKVYRVIACATEREALTAMQTEAVQAVVLEPTALNDADWSFVKAVRALPHYSHVPMVVCSTLDARRRGVELGVAAYLIKPVTAQALAGASPRRCSSPCRKRPRISRNACPVRLCASTATMPCGARQRRK